MFAVYYNSRQLPKMQRIQAVYECALNGFHATEQGWKTAFSPYS
jgi:hypothetical protein